MASHETIKLSTNIPPEQAGTVLAVNEHLHELAPRLKKRKPEDVVEALNLVKQYHELVVGNSPWPEHLRDLELEIDMKQYQGYGREFATSRGVAFTYLHGSGADQHMRMAHITKKDGQIQFEEGPDFGSVVLNSDIFEVDGKPCYLARSLEDLKFIGIGTEVAYSETKSVTGCVEVACAANIDGQLAHIGKNGVLGIYLKIENHEHISFQNVFTQVNELYDIGGKALITGKDNFGRDKVLYDGKQIDVSKYAKYSMFFLYQGKLSFYAQKLRGKSVFVSGDQEEEDFQHKSRWDILFAKDFYDNLLMLRGDSNGIRDVYYRNECLSDLIPHSPRDVTEPVFLDNLIVFGIKHAASKKWLLVNQRRESVETEFSEIFSIQPLEDSKFLVFGAVGKFGEKWEKKIFDLSAGWEK